MNIQVFAKSSESPSAARYSLWTRKHNHGQFWWKALVNVGLPSKYTINFEAVAGAKSGSDLAALDDISVSNGACPGGNQDTCDFEGKDFCDWYNNPDWSGKEFDWMLKSGPTPSSFGTGPYADHTLGTDKGTYVYIEASAPAVKGWRAQLAGRPMVNPTPGCVDFWYHMRGRVS